MKKLMEKAEAKSFNKPDEVIPTCNQDDSNI
jgi:hypothetical protein